MRGINFNRSLRRWVLLLAVSAASSLVWAQDTGSRVQPDIQKIGVTIGADTVDLIVHVYKPPGPGPFPLVLFSHGRAGTPFERAKLKYPVAVGHANYWLDKGFAVVAAIRPGYGASDGSDRENSFINITGPGQCTGVAKFADALKNAVDATRAVHTWALSQPWVQADRVVLEGQSVGGITTIAYAATEPKGVVAAINFAGGIGGSPERSPTKSCQPQVLTALYGEWGKSVKVPNLWFYAENDQFWGPEEPRQWHEAFKAGGSPSQFVQTGPVEGHDGHQLLIYGGPMWSRPLNAFLKAQGLVP